MALHTCVCVASLSGFSLFQEICYVIMCCIELGFSEKRQMQSQKDMRDRCEENQIIISCDHMLTSRICIPRKRFPVQREPKRCLVQNQRDAKRCVVQNQRDGRGSH